MKKLLVSILALSSYFGHAQENKPTGGCAYTGSIVRITPDLISDTYLLNGTSYSIKVNLSELNIPCTGDIKLKLDDIVIGQLSNCTMEEYTVSTVPLNVLAGEYILKFHFYGGYSGYPDQSLMASKKVTVLNSVSVKSASVLADIMVYPNPATDRVAINVTNDIITGVSVITTAGTAHAKFELQYF